VVQGGVYERRAEEENRTLPFGSRCCVPRTKGLAHVGGAGVGPHEQGVRVAVLGHLVFGHLLQYGAYLTRAAKLGVASENGIVGAS
jgi:hypothetical protein